MDDKADDKTQLKAQSACTKLHMDDKTHNPKHKMDDKTHNPKHKVDDKTQNPKHNKVR